MDPRPIIHCLVAWRLPDGDYIVKRGDPFPLDEAADFAALSWEVLPDPFDQEVLARWEQLNRVKPKWHRW